VEVEDLYRRGYREIYIHSDELNGKLDWSIDVCKAIAALGHKDLYFQCNLFGTARNVFEPCASIGCWWLRGWCR